MFYLIFGTKNVNLKSYTSVLLCRERQLNFLFYIVNNFMVVEIHS